MAKRLLFILMFIPFTLFIIVVLVASLFYWIFKGKDFLYLIDWGKKQMEGLLNG